MIQIAPSLLVQCQTAKINKNFKRCNLVRKAQKEILQKCDNKKDRPKANLMHVIWKPLQSTYFDHLSLILVSDWAGKICEKTGKPCERGSGDPAHDRAAVG